MSACTIKSINFTELPVHHIGGTSKFPRVSEVSIIKSDSDTWEVAGEMDAHNAYGDAVNALVYCKMTRSSNGNWSPDKIDWLESILPSN